MKKIKVLRVIARMNIGGPAFLIKELMTGLDHRKFEQVLVYGLCGEDEKEIEGIYQLGRTQRLNSLSRNVSIRSDFQAINSIRRTIRAEKPDIIDTHTFKAGFLVRLIYLFTLKKNVKIVHHYHGHLLNGYFPVIISMLYKIIEKILAKRTDAIITDGETITNELVASGIASSKKTIHLTPGVVPPNSLLIPPKQLGIVTSEHKLVVAFIGRLVPIKRPDRFLDLVKEMSKKSHDCTFLIYGEGELRDVVLEQIINENIPIELRPFEKDIYKVLSNVDLLVITSDNEGTPLTVMEASYAGVPCLGTNVGSMRDIIKDGVNGYLVDTTVSSLVSALQGILKNKKEFRKIQFNAANYASEHFNIREFIKAHEILYLDLHNSGN